MKHLQTVIKYCAIAFAIYIIYVIFSCTSTLISTIYTYIDNDKENITVNVRTISDNPEEISSLKLELKAINLEITEGDKFLVKTNNKNIKYTNNNGKIEIVDKSNPIGINKIESKIIINIPKNVEYLEKISGETGAGNVNISSINAKKINLELGAGNVLIEDVLINEEAKISGGAGNLNLKNCNFNNLNLELGIGKSTVKANISGTSKIETGVGEAKIILLNNTNKIQFSTGIGEININDKKIKNNTIVNENGIDDLKIEGGIGRINVYTR